MNLAILACGLACLSGASALIRIVGITHNHDRSLWSSAAHVTRNWECYAAQHGYELLLRRATGAPGGRAEATSLDEVLFPGWDPIRELLDAAEDGVDWLLLLQPNVLVMNADANLEQFVAEIPEHADIAIQDIRGARRASAEDGWISTELYHTLGMTPSSAAFLVRGGARGRAALTKILALRFQCSSLQTGFTNALFEYTLRSFPSYDGECGTPSACEHVNSDVMRDCLTTWIAARAPGDPNVHAARGVHFLQPFTSSSGQDRHVLLSLGWGGMLVLDHEHGDLLMASKPGRASWTQAIAAITTTDACHFPDD